MNINFLDIGTCDFDIGDGYISPKSTYLLVEPLQFYLDKIPNTTNILKANYAISNAEGVVDIYYIDENDIVKYELPYWIKGCNKIQTKHPTVIGFLQKHNIPENIILYKKVRCITFNTLIQIYNLRHVDQLKIDTEGHDHIILEEVLNSVMQNKINIDSIKLEYVPFFENINTIDKLREGVKNIYPNQNIVGENVFLSKK